MLLWNSVWSDRVRIGYNHSFGKGWSRSTSYDLDWGPWIQLSSGSMKTCGPRLLSHRGVRCHWKADWLSFALVKDSVSQTNQCDRKMGPNSFQWCPATGQGAMGTNWSTGSSVWTWGRASSLWGWRSTGTGCPGRLWSLLLWRYSRPAWTRPCAAFCRWPCFGRGLD